MTWWKKKPDDVLEWTVSEAGFDDAPEVEETAAPAKSDSPAAATQPPIPLRLPWQPAVLVVVPAAFILLGVWAWNQWNLWQTRREIEQTMSRESADPPRPLSFLERDEAIAPRVLSPTQWNTDSWRADIAYTFLAPDGQRYTFATPRFFFRSADASWQPTAPPDTFPGEIREYTSQWFTLNYYAADAELVEQTLIPYLERTLERACTLWRCAPPATLTLTDLKADEAAVRETGLSADEPLLFWLLATDNAQLLGQRAKPIAAPHTAGYPVDTASRELWQRTLVLRAFSQIFLSADLPMIPLRAEADNPWLSALAAIVATDLGLESPTVLRYDLSDEADLRQRLTYDRGAGQAPSRAEQAEQRRNLLALLNRFARQWPEVNRLDLANAIFRRGDSLSPFSELVRQSLQDRRPLIEWVDDWRELLGRPAGEVELPTADLMLTCVAGPRFYEAGELKPLLPFDEWPALGYTFAGWSPEGRYVSLGLGLSAAGLDTQTGLIRLPDDSATTFQLPLAWASDSMLAYWVVPAGWRTRPEDLQISFFNLANPTRRPPPVTHIHIGPNFGLISPNLQWLAVTLLDDDESDPGTLQLMSLLSDERRLIIQGAYAPAWSPDSREVAFLHWDGALKALALQVYNLETSLTRAVWSQPRQELVMDPNLIMSSISWSPDGQWIALALPTRADSREHWAGLVSVEGAGPAALAVPEGRIESLAFSPVGSYLFLIGDFPERQLLIYDVAGKRVIRALPGNWRTAQWSPDGRQLLLFGSRAALLGDALDPEREPKTLAESDECLLGAWKP